MRVSKAILPLNSILHQEGTVYDYTDSFSGEFLDKKNNINSTKIGKLFFTSAPKWVDRLFVLRNKIVGLLGLKTSENISNRQNKLDQFQCEVGERMGLFKVFSKTANEVILGEDDKHLNFRVSLYIDEQSPKIEQKKLTISTLVKFNNIFGRVYFLFIRPFHKIIVSKMLVGIIRQIEQEC